MANILKIIMLNMLSKMSDDLTSEFYVGYWPTPTWCALLKVLLKVHHSKTVVHTE